jgi:hypothetical protein
MTALFYNAASALAAVSLATLLVSLGYLVRSQMRMVRIQGEMLLHLTRIGMALEGVADAIHGGGAMLSANAEALLDGGWRSLSADDRVKLREALTSVLAQMAGEAPQGPR